MPEGHHSLIYLTCIFILVYSQAVNVDKICAMIPEIAAERCPDMEDQAQGVANKYRKALLLFSKCHNAYDSSRHFNDSDLSTLGKMRASIIRL